MKFKAMALLSLLVVASAHAAWVPFTSAKAKFSVDMPSKPKEETVPTNVAGKNYPTYAYTAAAGDGSAVAIITAIQTPGLTVTARKAVVDGYFNSFVKGAHATHVSRKPLTIHGYSGEEVVFKTGVGQGSVWVFQSHAFMYGLVVLGVKAGAYAPARARMFNSFKVNGSSIGG
jgi:hypothetical protein